MKQSQGQSFTFNGSAGQALRKTAVSLEELVAVAAEVAADRGLDAEVWFMDVKPRVDRG